MTENGFWEYSNLWRNGGDRDFVRYAATEPSPENKECDLCVDNSNNNSSKMADNKKKNSRNDAPEIKMVKSLGRVLSKQFVIPTIANDKSLDEDLTNNFNTSYKNAKTIDSIKRSLFSDNLNNTKAIQIQSKEDDVDTYNGNDVQDDGNANNDRVDLKRIPSRRIVSKRNY